MGILAKNKIIIGIIVVVIIALGAFFILSRGGAKKQAGPTGDQTQDIKQMKPEDIGLKLSPRGDKKAVVMEITKLAGVKTIEYEVDYNAKVTGQSEDGESGDVPRGVVGSPIDVAGKSEIKREVLLGTCSANVCKYDNVTSPVHFLIKVTFENGEVGSVEESLTL